ncbi:hypothetical protein [Lusitaniella coriacea]|uniref:hypothetical protein n=1 Tax=Lusitaniella coriacea TaxID=1983105 RepID=UPI003CFA26D4
MLEILTALITNSLSKLFDTSVEIVSKDISLKRSASSKFIDLFSSLFELEKTSKEIYHYLKESIEGGQVLTKVVIRKKLERFFSAYKKFIREIRSVQSTLLIYDNELLVNLEGVRERKKTNIEILDLMLEVSPYPAIENNCATTRIIYPTRLPSSHLVDKTHFPNLDKQDLAKEAQKIKRRIIKRMKFKTIDMTVPKESKFLLANLGRDVQQIEHLRKELSNFIKTNFPLDEILE